MEGIGAFIGNYNYSMSNITVNPYGSVNVDFNAYYTINIKWMMMSANFQALAYIDFLWLFNLYGGFGITMSYGYLRLDTEGIGTCMYGTVDIGRIRVYSNNQYNPRFFMGLFIVGFEINIWKLKISVESMVNISNGRDINIQAGTRFQI